MRALQRGLRGVSTSEEIAIALVAAASPLAAQKTSLTVTGGTITFPAPTAADYIAGFVNSTTGVTFTINSPNSATRVTFTSTSTNGVPRTPTVSIRSTSASLGNGKVLGDLQWRRSDLATWSSITQTNAQVEQRIVINKGLNDPWSNTVFFRMLLNWTSDAPATYTANY